eukprot:TRINITY_DN33282_c0_g1_i1.p1 TRINITY_DN33282_c0_g1~~TRINITY_DN33282_c0_g1_i1.p1  ORF type:complete len:845 (+),score=157.39 TRINITY_DN33282_c0_g1_i1:52-2586(+)
MAIEQPGGPYAQQPKAAAKPIWRTGQRVVLQGLEKAPELNGHRGVVVKWREDVGRYAIRVAGKEMGLKPENLKAEGGAAVAAQMAKKYAASVKEGTMYNPEQYSRVPGAGPKMTHWIGQVKAGRRTIVRAEEMLGPEDEPVPLWFGDAGFVGSAPVDVAILIGDVGEDPAKWTEALARTLSRFPAAAGRLRKARKQGRPVCQIVLNNAGVPFTLASVPPCGLPSADVLQLACQDDQCGFFDVSDYASAEEEPLLRLKLIHEEGTARGLLGVTFHHALCDIHGLSALLRSLYAALESSAPVEQPCHDRQAAQEVFDSVEAATDEETELYQAFWPLWPRALERWCFFARRLRSGLRGRPDGAATLSFSVPAGAAGELKASADAAGASGASAFEALVCFIGLRLLGIGRHGRRVLVTKDYRSALEKAAPGKGLQHLFANVVTHGLSFEIGSEGEQPCSLGQACQAMRTAIDAASLGYISWQSKQDHFQGLPTFFGSLCCNTWGRALSDLSFVEAYAVGMRSIDERANNMAFPLDTAYMQVLPQPSGAQRVLLTMPITDLEELLKELSASASFDLPHISEMRTHAFRVALPGKVVDCLCPTVETHHIFARIACVGDSITACGYPKYLQALFDRAQINVQVRNFGVPGATAQKFSDQPYWEEKKLEDVRLWRPHFVIMTLGTNDAKSGNWDAKMFEQDYRDLCTEFLVCNEPRPHLLLLRPPPAYEDGGDSEVQQDVVNNELPAAIDRIAIAAARVINQPLEEQAKRGRCSVPAELVAHTGVVDAFEGLGGANLRRRGYFAEDGLHPSERGTKLLSLLVFADLRKHVTRHLRKRADAGSAAQDDDPFAM